MASSTVKSIAHTQNHLPITHFPRHIEKNLISINALTSPYLAPGKYTATSASVSSTTSARSYVSQTFGKIFYSMSKKKGEDVYGAYTEQSAKSNNVQSVSDGKQSLLKRSMTLMAKSKRKCVFGF